MAKNIVADSGFWFGLFNARDSYHQEACSIESSISVHNLLVPWPSLYETMNTRLMRRRPDRDRFHTYLKRTSTILLDDVPYRDTSLNYVLEQASTNLSLVDHVIRSMLEDPSVAINALITFNPSDFIDVCQARRIELIDC
jgi:predicted nucleic acid-binding protein